MTIARTRDRSNGLRPPLVAAAMLIVAIGAGGGGSPAPLPEALVELSAVAALVVAVAHGLAPMEVARRDPAWAWLLAAIVALPLIQSVPIPSDWWRALPGRGGEAAALDAIGVVDAWRPWSLLPDETLAAALALLPALALALLTAARPPAARARLIAVLVGLAALSALLGIAQFAVGPDRRLTLFSDAPLGFAAGVFANRNAHADLLSIALVAALLLVERHRRRLASGPARAGVAILLTVLIAGTVLTGSRMGIATLAVPLVLAGAMVPRRRRVPALAGAVLLAMSLFVGGTAIDRVTGRVHDGGDRGDIWREAGMAARAVAPVGAGMGGFVPLFAGVERLEEVRPTYVNRAHDEWLELAIEGGAPALALLATTLAFGARRSWRGWSDGDPDRRLLARFVGLTTVILVVHATVDYPLRALALLATAGLALGGLARAPLEEEGTRRAALA